MILPGKYTRVENSIFYLSGKLLSIIGDFVLSPSELWEKVKKEMGISSYRLFLFAVTFLFMTGAIVFEDGLIKIKSDEHAS